MKLEILVIEKKCLAFDLLSVYLWLNEKVNILSVNIL